MRVLYLHQHFTTPSGSTGSRSYEQAVGLVKKGHEVHMICGSFQVSNTGLANPFKNGKRQGFVDGIYVTEFNIPYKNSDGLVKRSWLFLWFALRCIRLSVFGKYDVVFCTSTPLTSAIPGIAAAVLRKRLFIFEVRDLWPELPRALGLTNPFVLSCMSLIEWSAYRYADRCIGLSPGIVDGIKARSRANKMVELIPNGCDIKLFSEFTGSKPQIPGVNTNDFVAIFPGAHGVANGLDALLDTALVLKSRRESGIKIVFVGTGKVKNSLIERAKQDGLSNCIFLEPVPKTVLAEYFARSNIGLMVLANVPAFYHGTSPNKFFDFLANGLPVINNYPGWVASIIEREELGYVVAPDNPESFADALQHASQQPMNLSEQGKNAKRVAVESFNRPELVLKFVNLVENVATKNS